MSSRLLCLTQKLTDYYPEIIYKKGKHNTNPDALSRAFPVESQDSDWEDIDKILDKAASTPERMIVQELQESLGAMDSQASGTEELLTEEEEGSHELDTEEPPSEENEGEEEDSNLIISKVKLDVYTRIILKEMPDEEIRKRMRDHRN